VTRIGALLAMDTSEGVREAFQLARQLQQDAETISSELRLVQALTLQALALDALNDEERALVALQNALEHGQSSRLIRTFVDFGPALGGLLRRLLKSGRITRQDMTDRVTQLLAAFSAAPQASPTPPHLSTDGVLIEPLTAREEQVLELLAQRLTDREIADTLVISPFTVRGHLDNIRDKLGVRGRRAIVKHARHIGLIPAEPV